MEYIELGGLKSERESRLMDCLFDFGEYYSGKLPYYFSQYIGALLFLYAAILLLFDLQATFLSLF